MKIFRPYPARADAHQLVVLLGEGLIGSAVARQLLARGWQAEASIPVLWAEPAARLHAWETLRQRLLATTGSTTSCSVLWCAGKAGFGSSDADTAIEWRAFLEVLDLYVELRRRGFFSGIWHHVSSAGALFEGQRLVTADTEPSPARPYGHLKWNQEQAVRTQLRNYSAIYRLTSVFGCSGRGQRWGLIPVMVRNGILGRTSQIFGRTTTLRDFTWADDVAAFLAESLIAPDAVVGATHTLAAARPVSIGEVQRMIERTMRRRLYVSYSGEHNSADITFAPAVPPRDFLVTDLNACVSQVCRAYLAAPALVA